MTFATLVNLTTTNSTIDNSSATTFAPSASPTFTSTTWFNDTTTVNNNTNPVTNDTIIITNNTEGAGDGNWTYGNTTSNTTEDNGSATLINDGQVLRDMAVVYGSVFAAVWILFCYLRIRYPRPYTVRAWTPKLDVRVRQKVMFYWEKENDGGEAHLFFFFTSFFSKEPLGEQSTRILGLDMGIVSHHGR